MAKSFAPTETTGDFRSQASSLSFASEQSKKFQDLPWNKGFGPHEHRRAIMRRHAIALGIITAMLAGGSFAIYTLDRPSDNHPAIPTVAPAQSSTPAP